MRLVRYITLPLKYTISVRDGLQRKIDIDLKRIYITCATGGKSGFLPHDHRLLNQKRTQPRQGSNRVRDARRYRPGHEFRKTLKKKQPSGQKFSKGTSSGEREASKSF